MKYKVFVDGQEGTTGLKINERLSCRTDIELLKISYEKRKDIHERKKFLNEADIVFLCLPDVAARESVSLIENDKTQVIDASTAHRTEQSWAYGLPELSKEHREKIRTSNRVAVPGCHATGFNVPVYPLVHEGILPKDYPISCHSITGYSGGGKKLIEQYEKEHADSEIIKSPRFYSLSLTHKHLPEMQKINGLDNAPLFTPIVSNFYQGMTVAVPLVSRHLPNLPSAEYIHSFLCDYYKDELFVKVMPFDCQCNLENGYLGAMTCNHTNALQLFVFGHDEQILLVSRLDNLGKGSSGAAVQNMNILLGINEAEGLQNI